MPDYREYFRRHWLHLQQADLYQPQPNPTFHNPDFATAPFRILILRLSPFHDVARSTPHLFLYQAARRALPEAYIDMAFFPPQHDRRRFQTDGIPFIVGIQSYQSAAAFDLVLISNAYTLELINLPYLFLHSAIPLQASARDHAWPLFILGGSNALAAQAIITETGDSLVDALFFGEGEREVERLLRILCDTSDADKLARLSHAATTVTGLWVAGRGIAQPVAKSICAAPGVADLLVDYPRLNGLEADTARLQINYGCPAFCSFCFEGYERKPYRELPGAELLATARCLKQQQGATTLDLYSFNFNTHADILTLLFELNQLFEVVSFKSQRIDILHQTPGLLAAEIAADKRSLTLGIEGISARQRAYLHKSLATDAIMTLLTTLLQQKIRELKLFYILTGHETEADLTEFRDFVSALKGLRQRSNRGIRIIFSFGLLIRMPFTPLRYDRLFLDEAEWRRLIGPVKSACETNGFEYRLAIPWDEYAASQVLALGGYWLHHPLLALAAQGHCYDAQLTLGYWDAFQAWLMDHEQWSDAFLGEKTANYSFPLDFVDVAISAKFLYRQYELARQGVDEGYCLGAADAPGDCLGCGACGLPEQRETLATHTLRQPSIHRYWQRLPELMQAKWRLRPIYLKVRIPASVAGVSPEWLNAWALHTFLIMYPDLTETLLSVQESLFTVRQNHQRYANFYGETVFGCKTWSPDLFLAALACAASGTVPDVTVLGIVENFEPGVFQRTHFHLTLPTVAFPNAAQHLLNFLRDNYVSANARRSGAGWQLDLPAKALKKNLLFAGAYISTAVDFVAELTVSPKFDLLAFLQSFPDRDAYRLARVAVSELEL